MYELIKVIFGSIFVLFIPGFILTFSFKKKIDFIERTVLGFGLSIMLVPLTVLCVNRIFHLRITLMNSFFEVLLLSLIGTLIVFFRKAIVKKSRLQEEKMGKSDNKRTHFFKELIISFKKFRNKERTWVFVSLVCFASISFLVDAFYVSGNSWLWIDGGYNIQRIKLIAKYGNLSADWETTVRYSLLSYPPCYYVLCVVLYTLTDSLHAVKLIQPISKCFLILLVFLISRKIFGTKTGGKIGIVSAFLCAFSRLLSHGATNLFSYIIFPTFICSLLLYATYITFEEEITRENVVFLGLFAGYSVLVHDTAFLMASIMSIYILIRSLFKDRRRIIKGLTMYFALAIFSILPAYENFLYDHFLDLEYYILDHFGITLLPYHIHPRPALFLGIATESLTLAQKFGVDYSSFRIYPLILVTYISVLISLIICVYEHKFGGLKLFIFGLFSYLSFFLFRYGSVRTIVLPVYPILLISLGFVIVTVFNKLRSITVIVMGKTKSVKFGLGKFLCFLMVLLSISYVVHWANFTYYYVEKPSTDELAAWEWIRKNIPKDAIILTPSWTDHEYYCSRVCVSPETFVIPPGVLPSLYESKIFGYLKSNDLNPQEVNIINYLWEAEQISSTNNESLVLEVLKKYSTDYIYVPKYILHSPTAYTYPFFKPLYQCIEQSLHFIEVYDYLGAKIYQVIYDTSWIHPSALLFKGDNFDGDCLSEEWYTKKSQNFVNDKVEVTDGLLKVTGGSERAERAFLTVTSRNKIYLFDGTEVEVEMTVPSSNESLWWSLYIIQGEPKTSSESSENWLRVAIDLHSNTSRFSVAKNFNGTTTNLYGSSRSSIRNCIWKMTFKNEEVCIYLKKGGETEFTEVWSGPFDEVKGYVNFEYSPKTTTVLTCTSDFVRASYPLKFVEG